MSWGERPGRRGGPWELSCGGGGACCRGGRSLLVVGGRKRWSECRAVVGKARFCWIFAAAEGRSFAGPDSSAVRDRAQSRRPRTSRAHGEGRIGRRRAPPPDVWTARRARA